ncbi:MAG: SDR family NAD(P)-dependent oxidoreductase, partial [Pseudomonadota bacterium]
MRTPSIALVTGANRGIGRETARQLALDHGMTVFLGARDPAKGAEAAESIGAGVVPLQLDVADDASIAAAVDQMSATVGRLDCLVNNAGVDYDTDQRAATADLTRVRSAFATNLFGPWQLVIQALPLLRAAPRARVVNVSSGSGTMQDMRGGTPGYGVSKAALNALTLKLADELRGDGILVNAVCPGWVATDM